MKKSIVIIIIITSIRQPHLIKFAFWCFNR